ncbi:amidotransferase [Bifidobacterium pseudolongum subsp. pseudolongum]|uniref:gamma-glutamyl-gamma-aminobutyrate hydrolase family protein n=1 Tax=Bifidobacterium pseudolongum TaxID=1694 RepID=UPI000CBA55DB|nr:gamma-glutamyl-gamma-aminobutyrate hydrolase family protein [Bifidobacterium pseudolongum]PKV01120.1 amidotransferase [Bifidobacterium pseudolongum subsp. pseudolongum]
MRPTIAVMPLVDDERESLWMLPGYMDALREAGAVPFMPAVTTDDDEIQQIFAMCDGLLMTGGHDVEPRQYGEEPRFDNVVPNAERDTMELALLRLALAHDKPVFGICRGLQIMNVVCGGTLYQDLPSESIPMSTIISDPIRPAGARYTYRSRNAASRRNRRRRPRGQQLPSSGDTRARGATRADGNQRGWPH